MSDITLSGVNANQNVGVLVQLTIPGSQSGAATSVYPVLLLANGLAGSAANAAATATPGVFYGPNTLTPVNTVQDVINLFGAGSPGHLGFAAFKAKNTSTPVFIAPIEMLSAGTAATQTLTITAAGSPSQVTGIIQYQVDGKAPVQANFLGGSSPDSAATIATKLAAAINSNNFLPCTASATSNVVTVTANTKNQRTIFLRGFANVVSGAGVSVTPNSPAFFTGGAGSDASIPGGGGYLQVLNAIAQTSNRFYYYVAEAGWDSVDGYNAVAGSFTNGAVSNIQNQIDSLSAPSIGLRQRAIMGSVDTVAATQHTSLDVDDPRLECILSPNQDLTPFELACTWAAAINTFETVPLSAGGVNFDNFGGDPASQPFWTLPAPLDGSSLSTSALQSCIVSGVTPVKVVAGTQRTVVWKRCTSYFYPPSSPSVLDLRAVDAGIVTVADRFFDYLQNLIIARAPRQVIGSDPLAGSPPAPPNVMTPDNMEDICIEAINVFAAASLINGPQTQATLVVQENQNPATSIGISVTLYTANLLHTVLIAGSSLPALVI
jgi:phage tail sheath gpL-like